MTKYFFWIAIWACFCCILAMVGCAAPPPVVIAPTKAELQRAARIQMSNEHGCVAKCPAPTEAGCVDDEGYCWTTCAWDAAGYDAGFRAKLHELAMKANPEKSFLLVCPEPAEGREI